MAAPVKIEGLREMQRAFKRLDKDLSKELRETLKKAAEPVRGDAETRAVREIRNIGPVWSRMRTGVTQHATYVAPSRRRRGGSRRPNLAALLMDRAMAPALHAHVDDIEREVGDLLDHLFRQWEKM